MSFLIPELDLQIEDGGLGLLPADASAIQVKMGVCSKSSERAGELVVVNSLAQLTDELGTGPLVEAAAHVLSVAGGPVLCIPLEASIPGSVGVVYRLGNGEGTVAITGEPRDAYQIIIRITQKAETLGDPEGGAFEYSIDGGMTFSDEISLTSAFEIPNTGLTVTFTDAPLTTDTPPIQPTSFAVDDFFFATCTEPGFDIDHFDEGIKALIIDNPYPFSFIHLVGSPAPELGDVTSGGPGPTASRPTVTVSGAPMRYASFTLEITSEGVRTNDPPYVKISSDITGQPSVSMLGPVSPPTSTQPMTNIVVTITSVTSGSEKFKYKIGTNAEVEDVSFSPGGPDVFIGSDTPQVLKLRFPAGTYSTSHSWTFRVEPVAMARLKVTAGFDDDQETGPFELPQNPKDLEMGAMPYDIQVQFGAGRYLVGDTFKFDTSTKPALALRGLVNAFAVTMQEMETIGKFFHFALVEAPPEMPDEILTEVFPDGLGISSRMMIAAGACLMRSPIDSSLGIRSSAWPLAARLSAIPMHEDPGRVARGQLPNVLAVSRDENFAEVGFRPLDGLGFSTIRTITGLPGFYITAGRMLAGSTSDFRFVQHRRVMDDACRLVRALLLQRLNDDVKVNPDTGFIDEVEARAIETPVNSALRTQFLSPGHVSAISFSLSRTDNLLTTSTITGKVRIVPLGYLRGIEVSIGFNNPALGA